MLNHNSTSPLPRIALQMTICALLLCLATVPVLASSTDPGFGMRIEPDGFGMRIEPDGFGMRIEPDGFGMRIEPDGFGMRGE